MHFDQREGLGALASFTLFDTYRRLAGHSE